MITIPPIQVNGRSGLFGVVVTGVVGVIFQGFGEGSLGAMVTPGVNLDFIDPLDGIAAGGRVKVIEQVDRRRWHHGPHVIIAKDMFPLTVYRGVSKEDQAHPGEISRRVPHSLSLPDTGLFTIIPADHYRALPGLWVVDIFIPELHMVAIRCLDHHLITGIHAPDKVAEIFDIRPFDSTLHP